MKKKLMAVALATIIAVMAVAGASLAWLKDSTDTVTNTFTEGLVDIELYEHDYLPDSNTLDNNVKVTKNTDYKMIPSLELPKDPTVVVKAKSEACYVFIEVKANANAKKFLTYSIDSSEWTLLVDENSEGVTVYYKHINSYTASDIEINVLTDKKVTVNSTIEMVDMTALATEEKPVLEFTAYAIQALGSADATAAWEKIKN